LGIPCSFVNMKNFDYPEDKNPAESKNIFKKEKKHIISKTADLQKTKTVKKIKGEK
jgi:hypothetical protein